MLRSLMRTVAIIGRPNVGKSALFNRLVGQKISIVHDLPGVTRDRIVAVCRSGRQPFQVVDTGGIGAGRTPNLQNKSQRKFKLPLKPATFSFSSWTAKRA